MITLFHGANIISSRNALNDEIQKIKDEGTQDTVYLNGEKIDLSQLKQAAESQSLFGTDRMVIIENLFSRQKSKIKDELLNYLQKEEIKIDLLLWEKKQISTTQLKKFIKIKVNLYKISPKIFYFLDSLSSNNIKQMLILLQETKKIDAPEMIFYMLHRRISDLIIARDLGGNGLFAMQEWQKGKLIRQAKNFELNQLLVFHEKLYNLDFQIKTGKNILDLSSMLDVLISEI